MNIIIAAAQLQEDRSNIRLVKLTREGRFEVQIVQQLDGQPATTDVRPHASIVDAYADFAQFILMVELGMPETVYEAIQEGKKVAL